VFNDAFSAYTDFNLSSGSDIGNVIGTKNGQHGDRELLFVGAAANYAAKIVTTGARLSPSVYAELPPNLRELCTAVSGGVYEIVASQEKLDELLAANGISWNRSQSAERLASDVDAVPLGEIEYSDATVKIRFDDLSIRNNKRVIAASVFADVSGFTKYVDVAETDEERVSALRVFAALRREFAKVVKEDYNGVRVQYQGDRIQAIFHLPKGNSAGIALEAVSAAIGLQSSMEISLKEHLPEAGSLGIAVGVDLGTTLASFLGLRGQRDRICLGTPVERAAAFEDSFGKGVTAISDKVYELLPDYLQALFEEDESVGCYTASELTIDSFELAKKAKLYDSGAPVSVGAILGATALGIGIAAAAASVGVSQERRSEAITPSRTHGGEAIG